MSTSLATIRKKCRRAIQEEWRKTVLSVLERGGEERGAHRDPDAFVAGRRKIRVFWSSSSGGFLVFFSFWVFFLAKYRKDRPTCVPATHPALVCFLWPSPTDSRRSVIRHRRRRA